MEIDAEEIELQREITLLEIEHLANKRRELRDFEARRDKGIAAAKAALAKAEEPFNVMLAQLEAEEAEAERDAATELKIWNKIRKEQLIAGVATPDLAYPPGVSVRWLETPTVADPDAVPLEYWVPDQKRIKLVFKERDYLPPGVELVRTPSFAIAKSVTTEAGTPADLAAE